MKRQREFGDILMSSDIKQVPICGMTFGSMDHLPRQTAAVSDNNNELVPVIQNCNFTANNLFTISQPASADCTALSADYIWPSGLLCDRPDDLELTTDRVS